jgi:hypothetical protein
MVTDFEYEDPDYIPDDEEGYEDDDDYAYDVFEYKDISIDP